MVRAMLTLSLLRHGKSSWDDPDLDDFDRPLAKRGAKAAAAMGRYLARENLKPDLVLCSSAVRARATLALVLPELGLPAPEVVYDDALYLATPAVLLGRLRKLDGAVKHVLLVGHNPGLHALALELTGDGNRRNISALATKFPTAGLAVIGIPGGRWDALRPASGRLERFVTPREAE